MTANDNLRKKRKNARAIAGLGVALMSSSLVLFFITIFYHYAIVSPPHPSLGSKGLGPLDIAVPVFIEALIFVSGFLLLLMGLLVGLIGQLKKLLVWHVSKRSDST